jgi:penicillin-insensitive murein endopeptidase
MRSISLLALLASAGCTGPGLLTDGSSVSFGTTGTGALREGTTLPVRGDGYFVPKRWRERRRNYGTDELVRLMVRAARRVSREYRNSLLSVADLSPRGGGPTPEHRSHRSGRDVDLLFYHLDEKGKPVKATQMIPFDENGYSVSPASQATSQPAKTAAAEQPAGSSPTSQPAEPPPVRKLDVPRTWALVRALVLDPEVPVQWIFIGRPVARMLLAHARRIKEPAHIVELAAAAMQHTPAHMDHFHVRIFCSPSDLALGCLNTGSRRPPKRDIRRIDSPPANSLPEGVLARFGLGPIKLLGRF